MRHLLVTSILAVSLLGCGAALQPVGSETVESRSGDRPDWINTVPDNKGDIMYWVGRRTGGNSEEGALTDAREKSTAQIVNYLGTYNNKLYEYARIEKAANADLGSIGPYIKDLVQSFKRKVLTSGMRQKHIYTEKVRKVVGEGQVAYHYNAYVLMETSGKHLKSMQLKSVNEQLKKARAQNDKEAQKALKGMSDKLKGLEQ